VRVLLLSTTVGYQLRSFGESAARLGIDLMLATDRCHHLDDPWRDGAVPVRFHDEEGSLAAILDAARQHPLSGVLAVGDRPAVLAARVADALSLPGHPRHAADASRNKKLMRQRFAAAGLAGPSFRTLRANEDVASIAPSLPIPAVVKPLGLSGSRGVIRADTPEQLRTAVERVRALLARPAVRAMRTGLEDDLLIEGYIDGREYAVEAVMTNGTLRILAIFDKPGPLEGPFFEETIYVTPSNATSEVQSAIAATVRHAAAALGLVHGPVHAECRAGDNGVVILEVAARPIGGLCSKVLRFENGGRCVPLEELLLMHASGADISGYARESQAAGVMMIPIPTRGVFKGVAGEEGALTVSQVEEVRITAKPDQLLEPLPEGDSYLGFIFARGETPEQVVSAIREAHRRLIFRIEPQINVIGETLNSER
jgi:biotin carboxylase